MLLVNYMLVFVLGIKISELPEHPLRCIPILYPYHRHSPYALKHRKQPASHLFNLRITIHTYPTASVSHYKQIRCNNLVFQVMCLYPAYLMCSIGFGHFIGKLVKLLICYGPHEVDEHIVINATHCILCKLLECSHGHIGYHIHSRDIWYLITFLCQVEMQCHIGISQVAHLHNG